MNLFNLHAKYEPHQTCAAGIKVSYLLACLFRFKIFYTIAEDFSKKSTMQGFTSHVRLSVKEKFPKVFFQCRNGPEKNILLYRRQE